MALSWSELRDSVFTGSTSIFKHLLLVGGVKERELDRQLIGRPFIYAVRSRKTHTDSNVSRNPSKFIKGLAREGCRHVDGEFAHVANTFLILRGDRGNE